MPNTISILGSTGSIGVQALNVAKHLGLRVAGLTGHHNIALLESQIETFQPRLVAVGNELLAETLQKKMKRSDLQIVYGIEGLNAVATMQEIKTVVTSVVGIVGLIPTLEAIKSGKNIALANKETLVTAGALVMTAAEKHQVSILPVDSEHAAILQCMMGNDKADIQNIILTASGGPFRKKSREELKNVSLSQALKHPNWKMGSKITIDSATLMNKGLEVIEAKWLFGVETHQIQVMVHPQSIIHSMVEYRDGSVMAQLGSPDMRIPIQVALTYPNRQKNDFPKLNLLEVGALTFEEPDYDTFPCLRYAFDALKVGGTMPAVLNAANEVAVSLFLHEKIGFLEIPKLIESVMEKHQVQEQPDLEAILAVDGWARSEIERQLKKY